LVIYTPLFALFVAILGGMSYVIVCTIRYGESEFESGDAKSIPNGSKLGPYVLRPTLAPKLDAEHSVPHTLYFSEAERQMYNIPTQATSTVFVYPESKTEGESAERTEQSDISLHGGFIYMDKDMEVVGASVLEKNVSDCIACLEFTRARKLCSESIRELVWVPCSSSAWIPLAKWYCWVPAGQELGGRRVMYGAFAFLFNSDKKHSTRDCFFEICSNERKERRDYDKGPTILFKIVLGYMQTVALFASFDLKWPTGLINMFSTFETVAYADQKQLVSVQCVFQHWSLYDQTLLCLFFPLGTCTFFLVAWALWYQYFVRGRRLEYVREEWTADFFAKHDLQDVLDDGLIDGQELPEVLAKLLYNGDKRRVKRMDLRDIVMHGLSDHTTVAKRRGVFSDGAWRKQHGANPPLRRHGLFTASSLGSSGFFHHAKNRGRLFTASSLGSSGFHHAKRCVIPYDEFKYAWRTSRWRNMWKRVHMSMLIVFFIFYPLITRQALMFFNCKELTNGRWYATEVSALVDTRPNILPDFFPSQ
jgi:hypothetical protein